MSDSIPISVIVMTKDEANNIRPCLEALLHFKEVFVVDSGSNDGTPDIASALGATVVDFRWNGRYPKKKQWCLENLPFGHDWVLYVDADEIVPPSLAVEMAEVIRGAPKRAGYFTGLDYVFLGRTLRHGQRLQKLVLFNRHKGGFPEQRDLDATNMWEVEGHYQPQIQGPVGKLQGRILHKDHDRLYDWFERHNRYSDWEAVVRDSPSWLAGEAQLKRRILKGLLDRTPMRGAAVFLHSYVFNRGFLDGRAGFHFALARGFYYWQVGVKQRERLEVRPLGDQAPTFARGSRERVDSSPYP